MFRLIQLWILSLFIKPPKEKESPLNQLYLWKPIYSPALLQRYLICDPERLTIKNIGEVPYRIAFERGRYRTKPLRIDPGQEISLETLNPF